MPPPLLWNERPGRKPPATSSRALPPRSMVGQLTLDQHIGVRIPGGQPITHFPHILSRQNPTPSIAFPGSLRSQKSWVAILKELFQLMATRVSLGRAARLPLHA